MTLSMYKHTKKELRTLLYEPLGGSYSVRSCFVLLFIFVYTSIKSNKSKINP